MDVEKIKVGPVTVSLFAQEDRIVSHIRNGKGFEPASLAAWASMCEKGKTVLDIGGYSGLFAIAAAKLGCKAWIFEPMPLNVERIRMNARINEVKIEIVECVVSDKPGETEITFNPNVVGLTAGASLVRKKGFKKPVRAITIDSMCLDDICAVKIDVERGEPAVLFGAYETLARCKPRMLVEALGNMEREAVMASVKGYKVESVLDVRNLMMVPC